MAINLATLNKTPVGGLPPIMAVYGIDGIGKTGFALGAPEPAYLPTEPRFGHYEVANVFGTPEDPYRICGSFAEMMEAISALLTQDHGFKSVVLDTADHFEPMVWDAVLQTYPKVDKGEPVHRDEAASSNGRAIAAIGDYGYGKGYALALDAWRALLDGLDRLRRQKSMAVVILAHYQIKQEELADMEPYSQFQLKLHSKAASLIREKSDIVLFAKLKQFTSKAGDKDSRSKEDRRMTQGKTSGERVLVCQPNPAYTVKNSFNMPEELPLSWDAVAQYIPFFNKQQVKDNANA